MSKWIKTSERAPELKDADESGHVWVFFDNVEVGVDSWADHRYWDYWMPKAPAEPPEPPEL